MYDKIPKRWQDTLGSGIIVSVLDTGYSPHIDLKRTVASYTSVLEDIDSEDEANGHGNMCMGIIGANTQFSTGITGIAPLCKILSVRVADETGGVSYNSLAKGIYYSSVMGADVISISIGGQNYSRELEKAVIFAYEKEIPIIAAAGNDGHYNKTSLINYPAKFKETVCVGSIDENKNISWFSTIGPEIDFVSIGENIRSTYLNNEYKVDSGTSFSSPYVAGIAALILSKHRIQEDATGKNDCTTVDELKEHLRKHAVDLGNVGKDKYYGHGAISLYSIDHASFIQEKPTKNKIISLFKKVLSFFSNIID